MPTRVAAPVKAGGGETAVQAPAQQMTAQSSESLNQMNQLLGNEQDLARLNRVFLASPGMLRFATGGGIRRAITSFLTGIPKDQLIQYGQMADMMRVQGMQPQWAHLFVKAGIKNPGELSKYAGDDWSAQIQRGIVWGAMAAKAIELAGNGRNYSPPSYDQIKALAKNSVGLGSVINLGVPQAQP
ncbi:DUF4332 domain-containing protein [bacterium]|nr:DUF4332 domain-containing protein [bacterium]